MNKANEKYILTTKLFCGECKTMLNGESGNNGKNIKYRYYKCASARRHECDLKPVKKDVIEDFVVNNAVNMLKDKKTVDAIVSSILQLIEEENNSVLPALEAQLKEVRKAIMNLVKVAEEGLATRSTKEKLEELENTEDELKANIEREKASKPAITEDMIRFTLNKYVNLDLTVEKNREMIVDGLVGSVLIFNDGKVILTLNFRNEPIVSSLDEIISSANSCSDNACFASPKKSATIVADFFIQAA